MACGIATIRWPSRECCSTSSTPSALAHYASAQGEAGHRFDRVRDYLHDNYMRPITLDELAQVAALSPYHFQRQFKAHYHVTPHQMLMAIRLWRAKAFSPTACPPPK